MQTNTNMNTNTFVPCRLLGMPEDMPPNPVAPEYVTGGAGAACASAVAAGDVRFAVGVDHLAGIRARILTGILNSMACSNAEKPIWAVQINFWCRQSGRCMSCVFCILTRH